MHYPIIGLILILVFAGCTVSRLMRKRNQPKQHPHFVPAHLIYTSNHKGRY